MSAGLWRPRMDPTRSLQADGLDLHPVPVLSLDQIRAIRASNDYVDRPAELPLPPEQRQSQSQSQPVQFRRSSTVGSSLSRTSAASDQRLLGAAPSWRSWGPAEGAAVRAQPKGGRQPDVTPGKGPAEADPSPHRFVCERCGRCKCGECCAVRALPSCWACGQRCLCSPESAVEYGTCLCVVRGLFYHCSARDEDEDGCSSDRPCSLSQAHAWARWGAMGLLALCLPCLCCYPPARLCLSLCRRAHDRATRPGCRCRHSNTVCRKVSAPLGPAPLGPAPLGPAPLGPAPRGKVLEKPS